MDIHTLSEAGFAPSQDVLYASAVLYLTVSCALLIVICESAV